MTEVSCSTDFMNSSKEVAEKFLHTVIVVDDQAEFGEEVLPKPKPLKTPNVRTLRQEEVKSGGAENGMAATISPPVEEEVKSSGGAERHRLDVKKVMDLFASKGMVCSVMRPNEGEKPLSIIEKAAKRADVFILDWEIHNDNGDTAIKIINSIITSDLKDSPRLRLILIYTGEGGIEKISETIQDECAGLKIFGDNFTLSDGHLRIAIFAKEGAIVPDNLRGRVLSIEELPNRLSVEFAKITSGLVSNVVLEAISVIRDNTHLILGRLGPEIDPPYLAHRVLLPNPDDAMDHIIDILSSEIHSILYDHSVGKRANIDMIKAWLELKKQKGETFNVRLDLYNENLDLENICELAENGFIKSKWLDGYVKKKHAGIKIEKINITKEDIEKKVYNALTYTFCAEGEDATELDYKFARITSLKNRYISSYEPTLTLGTILNESVEGSGKDKYWLCIQPRCDCGRIEDKRNFLFLSLEKVDDKKKFNLIVLDGNNKSVRLKIDYTTYKSQQFEFSPDGSNQVILSKKIKENFIFETTNGMQFKWISELKNDHAQRISNDFAAKLSRVGLNESEWLRRWANK